MNKYAVPFFLVLIFVLSSAEEESQTTIWITPNIEEGFISVNQTYRITEKGLTSFEIYTVSLSYADLSIFDEQGDLTYEVGKNIIIGRNIYRTITIFFREPVTSPYTFTVKYWFYTSATGKPLTGKYIYRIATVTDTTVVGFDIPLTGITETARSTPTAVVEERENSTVFSYTFSEDAVITLNYEPENGLDYTDTETETVPYGDYTFEVTYPREAEVFLEDIEDFITKEFPVFLELTGIPLNFKTITISLDKEEDTWAAAEYRRNGNIRILINNTASYPSEFLAHELAHSYIGDFPRYLEEGMANYFEGLVASAFAPPRPENYIPNAESFFRTYERQFGERVDITSPRYGLGLTDHQEALIYAKYSKGTYAIYEIAYVCGHETMQEMLRILQEDTSVNKVLYQLTEGDKVYQILRKYGFDVVPPYAYPAEELLETVKEESWWARVLCFGYQFEAKVRTASPQEISQIAETIKSTGEIASKTLLIADGTVLVVFILLSSFAYRKIHRMRKENPKIVYYSYIVPVVASLSLFGYLLYQFLFNGYKFWWIVRNVLSPWGVGFISGVVIIILLVNYLSREGWMKYAVDLVWVVWLFPVVAVGLYLFSMGEIAGLGYIASLVVLFAARRRE